MFLQSIQSISAEAVRVIAVISLIAALLQTFFGYRLLRYLISLIGFAIGLIGGFLIAGQIVKSGTTLPVLFGTAVGSLLGWLSYKIYLFGAFLYCGVIASGTVMLLIHQGTIDNRIRIALCTAAFLAAGILAVVYSRPYLILMTAFAGSSSAVSSLEELAPELFEQAWYEVIILIGLGVMGAVLQFLMTHGEKKH
ncbi:MAG: hypothetical protein Q4B22_11845 [Eubacteriales bacterium]|nr:hypothetical protein [Eubacteriales bacterium]